MSSTALQFSHTVEKVIDKPKKPYIISHTDWLKNKQIQHRELLTTLPGRLRYGFTCKEDRDVFLLEFLGEFRIEQEQHKHHAFGGFHDF